MSSKKALLISSVLLFCLILFFSSTVFCQDMNFAKTKSEQEEPETPQYKMQYDNIPYTLGKEDIVEILVREQPDFTGSFVIGPDGKIQYPFVGDIQAEGLTKNELKSVIEKELEKYVKVPEVSIIIADYNSKHVYIMGEVARPGRYPMKGDTITLRDAIMQAGLPTLDAALTKVHIITPDEEKPKMRRINLHALLYKGKTKYNIDLMPEDIVVVPPQGIVSLNRFLDKFLSPAFRAAFIYDVVDEDR